jgi:hypothetical protein
LSWSSRSRTHRRSETVPGKIHGLISKGLLPRDRRRSRLAADLNRTPVLDVDAVQVSMRSVTSRVTSRYIDDEIEMEIASRAAVGKILSVETASGEIGASPAGSVGTARAKAPPWGGGAPGTVSSAPTIPVGYAADELVPSVPFRRLSICGPRNCQWCGRHLGRMYRS